MFANYSYWQAAFDLGIGTMIGAALMGLLQINKMSPFEPEHDPQYAAAFGHGPITIAQAETLGWQRWVDGECPVGRFVHVDICMRDGTVQHNTVAGALDWRKRRNEHDIIGYRVAE